VNSCTWCDEPVEPGQQHPDFAQPTHIECGFRAVGGSVAHVEHRCSCYVPGSVEDDPPGLTKREAAKAALRAFARVRRRMAMARNN